jgi:superfamily II DNA or RNA helicase
VIAVSPPRSGKTAVAYWIGEPYVNDNRHTLFFSHREELIKQVSLTYARFGMVHNIIGNRDIVTNIVAEHHALLGKSYVSRNAYANIGSVQTINSRKDEIRNLLSRINLWLADEAHHCLPDNTWGKVIQMMPHAQGVGFTATPARTDRKALGSSQGGIFDTMVKGVTARQLINEGYICDYRVIAPPSSIDRSSIKIGQKGEFTQKGLSEARRESSIIGDCVQSYKQFVDGQQAVVFAVDIAHAEELTRAYRDAGISAEFVSGKTQSLIRKSLMRKFREGVFKVLVNVDLFGEGLDVDGIECVIMARPTQSFVLYVQQFFRPLTKGGDLEKKGTIIDHAGNVGYFGKMYGLPDAYNAWTLEISETNKAKQKTTDAEIISVTTCVSCFSAYEAYLPKCPHCGHKEEPADRVAPEHVEGDLIELSQEVLQQMRNQVKKVDGSPIVPHHLLNTPAETRLRKLHVERQEHQKYLRDSIAMWAGYWKQQIESSTRHLSERERDSAIHRRFFQEFGVDVMTAQTFNMKDAGNLRKRVDESLDKLLSDS